MGARSRCLAVLASLLLTTLALAVVGPPASAGDPPDFSDLAAQVQPELPVEPYARYQPQTKCKRTPKAGILQLADALVAHGGGYGPIARSCGRGTSEHYESRAFDWTLDASKRKDRRLARAFLKTIFATDDTGEQRAIARRMGIMYIIWNDRMWAAYSGFEKRSYLSSSCRRRKNCSTTLRHRDHMHISLTRKGARGKTSWYLSQPTG